MSTTVTESSRMRYCKIDENKLENTYLTDILISLEFTTINQVVVRYVTIHCNSILYYKYDVGLNVCHSYLFEKLLTITDIFSHCCLKSKTFLVNHTL